MAKETTPKSSWPKRGIHGSNRDKSQDESMLVITSMAITSLTSSRKRALTLMDNKDLESSDHKVNVDELEQEDEVDELEDNDNMPQSDEHGHIDQEESRDKVHKDNNDNDYNDDNNGNDNEYIKDNPDCANKQPADLDDELFSNFHADNKGKQQSKVTELDDKEKETYLDKEVKHEQGGRPSSHCPHGSKLGKTSLASIDRDELCWKLIQESAVKAPGLEQVLAEVEKEQNMKERLLDYIWGADTQSMTCDESKSWQNPIFLQLIKMQWWGPKEEGRHLGSDPATNPYLNALATTLALVATAVECVLTGLFSGGVIDFNENVYSHGRFQVCQVTKQGDRVGGAGSSEFDLEVQVDIIAQYLQKVLAVLVIRGTKAMYRTRPPVAETGTMEWGSYAKVKPRKLYTEQRKGSVPGSELWSLEISDIHTGRRLSTGSKVN
ncbi:hypothetical protein EDC04DRAFT_2611653 [Pisolithus marmoratus]|nr:hypothetical protein EDC04DRAFT_2611653 [Pisolithus marmoratus]